MTPGTLDATNEEPPSSLSMKTMVPLALVAVVIAAAVTVGQQMQRLDTIDNEVRESRIEMRALRTEVQSLRELLIQRTSQSYTPTRTP